MEKCRFGRRSFTALALAGSLGLLAGCGTDPSLGPSPTPRSDEFDDAANDGDYSVQWFDIEPRRDLKIRVAQNEAEASAALVRCDPIADPQAYAPAWGNGEFRVAGAAGTLTVQEACYYDGWHPNGFPQSVVATGTARSAGMDYRFVVNLKSTRFPTELTRLDRAFLTIPLLGVDNVEFRGELHHEDKPF